MLFKNRFGKEKIFHYTPDFKTGFSHKFKDVFEASKDINMVYSSNTETDEVFSVVCYQSWEKKRVWQTNEMNDMFEMTKILSMFIKSSRTKSERERQLQERLDYCHNGLYTIGKFYEEAGRIGREARRWGEKMAIAHFDIKNMYRFNRVNGREAGNKVMLAFAAFLLKADSSRVISTCIPGTDVFISLFRYSKGKEVSKIIEAELKAFCEGMGEFGEFPLVVKAGMCSFSPGQLISTAIDIAKELKRGIDVSESICISRKMLPSENGM
jgi:GGDEF domain-containing protein